MKKNGIRCLLLERRWLKMYLAMKFLVLFLCISSSQLIANVYSQVVKVSLEVNNASLEQVIRLLEKESGYLFLYEDAQIEQVKGLELKFRDEELKTVLDECLQNSGLTYKLMNQTIVIVRKEPAKQTNAIEKVIVRGVVKDVKGQTLPGVSVVLKETTMGVATDANGKFVMEIPKMEKIVLVCSFMGMETKEVTWRGEKELSVVLAEQVTEMEEAVVTGIYTRKKESFTGSAATYTKEDLKMIGTSNIIQSLKTLDPAMLMLESKEMGSDPNTLPNIEIRGKTSVIGLQSEFEHDPNQPLFILDGVETDLQTIVNLNMDRVASVTILKDAASTAIYGSKAANGVIVVETVQPEAGKLRLSYNGNYGISFPDLTDYNLMNAREKLEFERLSGKYTDKNNSYITQVALDEKYFRRLMEVERGVDTYWLSEPLRTVFNHSHNLYIDGGDEAMRYGLGLGYKNSDGVMKGSNRDIFSGNIDLSYRKKSLLFSNKFSMDVTNSEREPVSFSDFAWANPYNRKTTENGEIPMYLEGPDQQTDEYINPLYKLNIKNTNETKTITLRDNFIAEWQILSSLRLQGRFGLSKSISKTEAFKSPKHPEFRETEQLKRGSFTSNTTETFSYNGDLNLTFGKLIAERHQVNVVGGMSINQNKTSRDGYSAIGFTSDFHINPAFSMGFTDGQKPSFSREKSRAASFFMNVNYSFANRYLMDCNVRSDGTSRFGANKRFSTTWAVGLAWNLHNENFMKALGIFDNFKIRASIGNPGNQNFDAYQAMKTYRYNVTNQNVFGTSAIIDRFGNNNLDWQRTLDKNIGVDLAMLGNRLKVAVDYYYKDTDPLLVSLGMPPSLGTTSIYTNFGRQISQGWNGTLSGTVIKKNDLSWTINFNFRTSQSEYREIGDKLDYLNEKGSSKTLLRYYEGASPDDMWAVPSLGIDPATGREVFLKKDGTQTFIYSADDEVVVGSSRPYVEGIIGTSFYWKGFSASVNFRYRIGGEVMASALYNKVENISDAMVYRNQDKRALYDRWQKPGDHAKFKGIQENNSTTPMSSRFVMTENTFSGESISLGYETNATWLKYIGANGLTLRAYMNEIFRISSFKEERGTEYPFARSVTFSLSLRF